MSGVLTVDVAAIRDNITTIMSRTHGDVMAVVKADGYGVGAATVARAALACGVRRLGVTSLDEALELRAAGIDAPILSWLNPPDTDWALAAAHNIAVTVPSHEHLRAIHAAQLDRPISIHLQFDTGMARDGCSPTDCLVLLESARESELSGHIKVSGLMGHLAHSAHPTHPGNQHAAEYMTWVTAMAAARGFTHSIVHLGSTASALHDPTVHFDMVRVGAGLVGIDPSGIAALQPVATLTAPVVQSRRVEPGTGVGYDHMWHAEHDTNLALIPLGYADGIPRNVAGRAHVSARGQRFPLVGRVSMDQIVIDTGDTPLNPGDTVTIFGSGSHTVPTLDDWARWADTLPHEIITGIASRVTRQETDHEELVGCRHRRGSVQRTRRVGSDRELDPASA